MLPSTLANMIYWEPTMPWGSIVLTGNPMAVLLLSVLFLAAVLFIRLKWYRPKIPRRFLLLYFLLTVVLSTGVLCPNIVSVRKEKPVLTILADDSRSMNHALSGQNGQTPWRQVGIFLRWQIADNGVNKGLLEYLNERYDLRYVRLSDSKPVPFNESFLSEEAKGDASPITESVESVHRYRFDNNSSSNAILLFSDGIETGSSLITEEGEKPPVIAIGLGTKKSDGLFQKKGRKPRILYISDRPDYEYRSLSDLLRREPDWEVKTVLLSADHRTVKNNPGYLSATSLDEHTFSGFDLVIYRPDEKGSPDTFSTSLMEIVLKEGSHTSLWIMEPRLLTEEKTRLFTPLFPGGEQFTLSGKTGNECLFAKDVKLTDSGKAFFETNVTFKTYDTVSFRTVSARASSLATVGEHPVLLYLPLSSNSLLWQGTDTLWTLREKGEDIYRTFILELVSLLLNSRNTTTDEKADWETVDLTFRSSTLRRLTGPEGLLIDLSDTDSNNFENGVRQTLARLEQCYQPRIIETSRPLFPPWLLLTVAAVICLLLWREAEH